ncbi:hypothetical protein ACFS4T_10955 [Pseudomonas lini]
MFAFETPAQVFDEYKHLTRDRDLDLSGISHELIDQLGPQQWPFPAGAREGTARLYLDGVFPTASGRAQFVTDPYRAAKEQRDARFSADPDHRPPARSMARHEPHRYRRAAIRPCQRSRVEPAPG